MGSVEDHLARYPAGHLAPPARPGDDQTAQAAPRAATGLWLDQLSPARLPPGEDSYQANPPKAAFAELFGPDAQHHDEKKFRLCDLLHAPEDWLIYEYDFGDSWEHEVFVEKILPGAPAKTVTCLAGARAAPPEDCGGVPGYYNLLEAIAHPKHRGDQELLEWLGEPYDPAAFHPDALNSLFKKLKL